MAARWSHTGMVTKAGNHLLAAEINKYGDSIIIIVSVLLTFLDITLSTPWGSKNVLPLTKYLHLNLQHDFDRPNCHPAQISPKKVPMLCDPDLSNADLPVTLLY